MLKIILSGACGRMGAQVTLLSESRNVKIVAGVDVNPKKDMPYPVYPDFSMVQEAADAIIDFSRPEGLHALLTFAKEKKLPVVLAATGYNENDLAAIREAAMMEQMETAISFFISFSFLEIKMIQKTFSLIYQQ